MDLGLKDKKVLVTGGSKGLGLGLVRGFLEEGCQVVFCSRQPDAPGLEDTLAPYQGRWWSCVADLSNEQEAQGLVEDAAAKMSGIDVLINNAGGIKRYGDFFELNEDDWQDCWQTNFMSAAFMVKYAYPYLKSSESGRILNVSSITALQPGTFNPHYSASKAALINFSKHLANRFADDGILVNTLAPGNFESGGWQDYLRDFAKTNQLKHEVAEKDQQERVEAGIPLGRMGIVEEIVPLVLLASSPSSAWMTGSCIVIDGGKVRSMH